MSQIKSIQSGLLDPYDELALDLEELKALAYLIEEPNSDIDRSIHGGLGGILGRIHASIRQKHAAISRLFEALGEVEMVQKNVQKTGQQPRAEVGKS